MTRSDSQIDQQTASVSLEMLPRPISSRRIKLFGVRFYSDKKFGRKKNDRLNKKLLNSLIKDSVVLTLRMYFNSLTSSINEELFIWKLSFKAIRVKSLSHIRKVAYSAGTKDPICANICSKAICLRNVVLPLIFDPVMIWKFKSLMSRRLFGTESPIFSTIGWTPCDMTIF